MGLFDFIPDEQSVASGLLGLSGQIRNYGNWQKQRIKSLLSDPVGYIKSGLDEQLAPIRKQAAWQRSGIDAMTGSSDTRSSLDNQVVDYGMNQALNAPAITVWHGSPHKFNKFDMSKMGTGEGAQAYGHGLYMAEAPQVAKDYQKTLANDGFLVGDKVFDPSSLQHVNIKHIARSGDVDAAIAKAQSIAASDSPVANLAAQDLARLQEIKAAGGMKPNEGALYKVDIPDEAVARFLDWDKPLSQQAPEVREAIAPWVRQYGLPMQEEGRSLYSVVKEIEAVKNGAGSGSSPAAFKAMAPQASEQLLKAGIPGIRYLDGGSRGQQAGTSNFVLFDDNLPRILEINGSPTGLSPWKPGEWNGGLLGIGK